MLRKAAALELDDYFEFTVERASAEDDLDGGGERWTVDAIVAGRLFERVAIDMGFGEPVLAPETVVSSKLLVFAGVEPTTVRAIASEQHIAEKLHAYTRTYARGPSSSRVKDLVDLAVIANTTELDARRLRTSIDAIFSRRGTHPVPDVLPPPPTGWGRSWAAMAAHVPAADTPTEGHGVVGEMLDPILAGDAVGTWDPRTGAWV